MEPTSMMVWTHLTSKAVLASVPLRGLAALVVGNRATGATLPPSAPHRNLEDDLE